MAAPLVDPWAEVRAIALLAVLLVFAGAAAWRLRNRAPRPGSPRFGRWLRWLGPSATAATVQVIHSARLTPRASVHVLRWDDREWLVGCTDQGMTVIAQREAPTAEANRSGAGVSSRSEIAERDPRAGGGGRG